MMGSSRLPRTELPEGRFVGSAGPRDGDFQGGRPPQCLPGPPARGAGALCVSSGFSNARTLCWGAGGAEGTGPQRLWETPPASQEAETGSRNHRADCGNFTQASLISRAKQKINVFKSEIRFSQPGEKAN